MKSHHTPVESLEQRRMFTTIKGNDTRIVGAADNTKENANDIVLTFNGALNSTVDTSKIRLYGYANNTLLGGQVKVTIPISSYTVSGDRLTLRTGVQVRKRAFLKINAGAVKDASGANADGDIRLRKGANRDRFTLALRAYTVSDKSYFSSSVLSGGATAATAPSNAGNESVVTPSLTDFLNRKVNEGSITSAQRTAALTLYNSAAAKAIIPAANLRAAVVSLTGTVAESAIDVWLGTGNSTGKVPIFVGFDSAGLGGGAPDAELAYNTKGRLKLTFANDYVGENFVVLSSRIAHETLHDGGFANNVDSQDEEVVANFVESSVWAQQIVTDYRFAANNKTKYTLYANYHLYALLNSGDRQFPRVGLKDAPLKAGATNATPGFTTSVRSFDALIRRELTGRISDKAPTSITAATATILNRVGGGKYAAGTTTFGKDLINSLDQTQGVIADSFGMRAARVLQVKIF